MDNDMSGISKTRMQQKYDEWHARLTEQIKREEQQLADKAAAWFSKAKEELADAIVAALDYLEAGDDQLRCTFYIQRHPYSLDGLYDQQFKQAFELHLTEFGFNSKNIIVKLELCGWEFQLSAADFVKTKPKPIITAVTSIIPLPRAAVADSVAEPRVATSAQSTGQPTVRRYIIGDKDEMESVSEHTQSSPRQTSVTRGRQLTRPNQKQSFAGNRQSVTSVPSTTYVASRSGKAPAESHHKDWKADPVVVPYRPKLMKGSAGFSSASRFWQAVEEEEEAMQLDTDILSHRVSLSTKPSRIGRTSYLPAKRFGESTDGRDQEDGDENTPSPPKRRKSKVQASTQASTSSRRASLPSTHKRAQTATPRSDASLQSNEQHNPRPDSRRDRL